MIAKPASVATTVGSPQTGIPPSTRPLSWVGLPASSKTCQASAPLRCQLAPSVQTRIVSPWALTARAGCLRSLPAPGALCCFSGPWFDFAKVNLPVGIPSTDHTIGALHEGHCACRSPRDLPLVNEASLEALALVLGSEQVHVSIDLGSGRTIQHIHRSLAIGKGAKSAATASTRGFRPRRRLLGKVLASVRRARHPNLAMFFILRAVLLRGMPDDINVSQTVRGHGTAAIE